MGSRKSTKSAAKKKPVKRKPVKKKPVTGKTKARARSTTRPTTLVEIIRQLDNLDDGETIYMRRPWSATAECLVAPPTYEGAVPEAVKAAGYEYFLEIDVVREVLEIFSQWPDKPPTEDEKVRAVLYYGDNDAWPQWVHER